MRFEGPIMGFGKNERGLLTDLQALKESTERLARTAEEAMEEVKEMTAVIKPLMTGRLRPKVTFHWKPFGIEVHLVPK